MRRSSPPSGSAQPPKPPARFHFTFTLTARAENFIAGRPDLSDAIARLQAYQEAGAGVLYAPGISTRDDIAAVVRAVDRPVNVLMMSSIRLTLQDLAALGVKRVSTGGALARAAHDAILRAVSAIGLPVAGAAGKIPKA